MSSPVYAAVMAGKVTPDEGAKIVTDSHRQMAVGGASLLSSAAMAKTAYEKEGLEGAAAGAGAGITAATALVALMGPPGWVLGSAAVGVGAVLGWMKTKK